MNTDLHELFKREADSLDIGPPPYFPDPATAGRRRRVRSVSLVGAAVALCIAPIAVSILAPTNVPSEDSGSNTTAPSVASEPEGRDATEAGLTAPPAVLPDCGNRETIVRFVDAATRPTPTALMAVEALLGKKLDDADAVQVTPYRVDFTIGNAGSQVRGAVTVVRIDDKNWIPTTIYSCPGDIIKLAP